MKKVTLTAMYPWMVFYLCIIVGVLLLATPVLRVFQNEHAPLFLTALVIGVMFIMLYVAAKQFMYECSRIKERTLGVVALEKEYNKRKLQRTTAAAQRYQKIFEALKAEEAQIIAEERGEEIAHTQTMATADAAATA